MVPWSRLFAGGVCLALSLLLAACSGGGGSSGSGSNPKPPAADFTAAPLSGAAPLPVVFTDLSDGEITDWAWDFGDGGISTLSNPQHIYLASGTFAVSLAVTGPGGSDTLTRPAYVVVDDQPLGANFQGTPLAGFAPLTVDFTDTSAGPITNWSWDFGDGGSGTAQHPTHPYASPGTYTVSLTVTSAGDTDTLVRVDYIAVGARPDAGFSATPTSGIAPLTVDFTDQSTGQITSWSWDFGDGGTSTEASPTHVYLLPGSYSVSLEVTGPGGTDDEVRPHYISVGDPPPSAGFVGAPTSGDVPLVVQFADQSSGAITAWNWDFGDGGTSNAASPAHTYSTAGTYTVRLQVQGPGGVDQLVRPAYITASDPAPVAGFVGAPTSGETPLVVVFTDQSTGPITSWSWDFGDGGSSAGANPAYTYTAAGTYSVRLTVVGPGGSDAFLRPDYVAVVDPAPGALFVATPTSGDASLDVAFTDQSTGPITSWSWEFGDGATSSLPNPAHTYDDAGTYSVRLTVEGPGGSDEFLRSDYVEVVDPAPIALFVATPTTGDAPLDVAFTDQSSGPITSWSWDFGDGSGSAAQHPAHTFDDAGTYSITLEVTGPGGVDDLVRPDYLVVDPTPCPPPTVTSFQTIRDLWYGSGTGFCSGGDQCLDLYLPDDPRVCAPTIVWFHGGGWTSGAKDSVESIALAQALAADGWPVVSVGYTLSGYEPCLGGFGTGSFPQAYLDAKQAIDWVNSVGTLSFGLPDEVVVVGSSAGGTLAAMLGATQGLGEILFDPAPGAGDYSVDRVVLFSTPTNLVKGGCRGYAWPPVCAARCPGPPNPPANCSLPPGCKATGGFNPGYPCRNSSGNCQDFTQPEQFLGEMWGPGGDPAGVDCTAPLSLPPGIPAMPTAISWYDASPYFWLSGEEPPFHLVHSQCDPLVPLSDATQFAASLLALGGQVNVISVPAMGQCDEGCQHGATAVSSGDPSRYLFTILNSVYVP